MGGNAAKERRRLKRIEQAKLNAEKNENKATVEKKVEQLTPESQAKENNAVPAAKPQANKKPNAFKSKQKTPSSKRSNAIKSKSKFKVDKAATSKPKKNKIKKPKHLARKMKEATDPIEMEELLKKQEELELKKAERSKRFKARVIAAVGGKELFDEQAFDSLMKNGGGKLESIVEAVKIQNNTEKQETIIAKTDLSENKQEDGNVDMAPEKQEKDHSVEVSTEANNVKTEAVSGANRDPDDDSSSTSSSDAAPNGADSGSDGDSDSDSDSDGEGKSDAAQRSRGRGRRGRKEADAKREALNLKQREENQMKAEEEKTGSKKTPRSEDKRRCIGRKPLTDFEVGKKYTGTVKYVKSNLGVFIDIGCHSDAFCHISRASDDFIESITDDVYKSGDVLENKVRIVDIDRAKKRITASLQSDSRIEDEEKSAIDYRTRSLEKAAKKRKMQAKNDNSSRQDFQNHMEVQNEVAKVQDVPKVQEEVPIVIDPDNMTPAELKRARKLQRRAERRKQKEETGISA